ncbi:DUF6318 family protein [Terrabacter sp. 2YAF2]|uniref:DUF6318 family protein n=1 Tax=Terrabacter sp. 2YAF2 TaxID=3233026 RepID=UPI003F97F8B4
MTAAATPHRHRTLLPYAAALIAVATLGACTGRDPGPSRTTPPASTTTSASPTTTTTTPVPSPTTSVDPVIAKIPANARPETQAGAAAFSEFYFEQLNRSFKDASPELLEGLFESSCKICVDLHKSASELKAASQHHDGDTLKVTFSSATIFNSRQRQVLVKLDQFAVPIVDSHGKRVDTTKAGSGAFVAVVTYKDHWVITDLGRPS